jgi:hypothetical protein
MDTPDAAASAWLATRVTISYGSPDAGIKIVKHEVFAAPIRPMLDVA